ncbi:MAG TPA: phosphoglucosamine mutase [Methanothermobacter sp.]|nr:phosphoglucosamine mutase [Methanothermobacter sp.]HPU37761.1 phosphoglucosamine mutase [Methanothermobacter sp.]
MKKLFGTFGVRRIANKQLTPEFASRLSAAFGSLTDGKIAVGGDTRTSTPMIKHAVIAGLLSTGCDVVDLGILPTPTVQYAVRKYYDAGVIITASHNPPQYNGIKFVDEHGIGIKEELEEKIEKIFFEEKAERVPWDRIGSTTKNRKIIREYIDEIIKRVDADIIREANFTVVVDCGSGAGSYTTPYLLRELGCEVLSLNCQPDGFFPGRDPEPTPENLKNLMDIVKTSGADLGIAHDGDADRTICIDEKGDFIFGDKTFALVEKKMLQENKGGLIVTTVATTSAIYDIAKENNGKVITTPVGDLIVARTLKEKKGLFGGEENGGLIFPDFVYGRDGALSAAKILEIMAEENKPISKLVAELPRYYSEKMKIECPDELKPKVMATIQKKVEKDPSVDRIDTTDGVKIFKEDGWVIIRPSGTEPIFRCFAEAKSQEKATQMAKWGISIVKRSIDEIG